MTHSLDRPFLSTDAKRTKTRQRIIKKASNPSNDHSSEGGLLGILSKSWARSRVSCSQTSPALSEITAAMSGEQDSSHQAKTSPSNSGDMVVVDVEETVPKETVTQSSESKPEEGEETASWDIPQESVPSMRAQSCHGNRPAQALRPVAHISRPHSCTPALSGGARSQREIPQVTTAASKFSRLSQENSLSVSTSFKWSSTSSTAASPSNVTKQTSIQSRGVNVGKPTSSQRSALTKKTNVVRLFTVQYLYAHTQWCYCVLYNLQCTGEKGRLLTRALIGQPGSRSCDMLYEIGSLPTDVTSLGEVPTIAPPPPSPMEVTCNTTDHLEVEKGTISGKISFTK